MDKLTLNFVYDKETKNTVRFKEQAAGKGNPPIIGTLYVMKWAFTGDEDGVPNTLKVTIE